MARHAISVTLDAENLTWLKGRVGAGRARSVSDLLNRLVTEARAGGIVQPSRSVRGTIAIDPSDPGLEGADAAIGLLFERSVDRPFIVRERGRTGARARRPVTRRG